MASASEISRAQSAATLLEADLTPRSEHQDEQGNRFYFNKEVLSERVSFERQPSWGGGGGGGGGIRSPEKHSVMMDMVRHPKQGPRKSHATGESWQRKSIKRCL